MVEQLIAFSFRLGHWTYAVIFLAATLEASAFLGLLVPGETLTVAAGFLSSAGVLELGPTIVAAAGGAIVGDSIGYEMGRRLGRPWLVRNGERFGFSGKHLARLEALFARHGGRAIVLARFVGFLRALAPFVAGAARMPYGWFLLFNVGGAWAWALCFVSLGYVLAESWWVAERWIGRAGTIAAAIVIAGVLLWFRRARHVAATGS